MEVRRSPQPAAIDRQEAEGEAMHTGQGRQTRITPAEGRCPEKGELLVGRGQVQNACIGV